MALSIVLMMALVLLGMKYVRVNAIVRLKTNISIFIVRVVIVRYA